MALLGLRSDATRKRQSAGDQRDEGATRRLVRLIAHGSLLTVCVRLECNRLVAATYKRASDTTQP
jgi:hypothetical protein